MKKATVKGVWNTLRDLDAMIQLKGKVIPIVCVKRSKIEVLVSVIESTYQEVRIYVGENRFQVISTRTGTYFADFKIANKY